MRYRFFKVPLHGGEAEDELNRFLAGHRIVSVDRELVACGEASVWALCLGYEGSAEALPARKGKIDYRELLDDADFGVFAKLRALAGTPTFLRGERGIYDDDRSLR
jgi:hypothetical protein